MKWFGWLVSIFFLLTLESGVFGQLGFLPVVPGLALVFCAVAIILEDNRRDLAFIIIATGVMLDLVSALPDGILLLSLCLAAYLTYYLIYLWLAKDYHTWLIFLSSSLLTVLFLFFTLAFIKLFALVKIGTGIDYAWTVTHQFVWYIVINAAVTYPIYLYSVSTQTLARKIFKTK